MRFSFSVHSIRILPKLFMSQSEDGLGRREGGVLRNKGIINNASRSKMAVGIT